MLGGKQLVVMLLAAMGSVACGSVQKNAEVAAVDPTVSTSTVQGLDRGLVFPSLVLPSRDGECGPWSTFDVSALRDPTGERGVTGIYVIACSVWSADCKEQIQRVVRWSWGYGPRGARFVGIIAEGAPNAPPTKDNVDEWVSIYRVPFPTLLDAKHESVQSSDFPTTYLVDPRTMRIVHKASGVVGEGALCKTDRDCCDATRWDCSAQDARCSTTFGACLGSSMESGPMPALDALLEANGAAPIDPFSAP
jgi:hypothetical protein